MSDIHQLEARLDSFDSRVRREALEEIAEQARRGDITLPPTKEEVNLHYHTFFSFNANGWSPSRIAWEARKYGLEAAGIVDFDVLDGMEEFLAAGELLNLKTVVGFETRVFIRELSEHVMSSPNEPGIAYFMGSGCFRRPPAGSEAERILQAMAKMARARNMAVMERVNAYLGQVRLDYDADVVPLTPSGNATERHLLLAYDRKAREVFPAETELAAFWSGKLDLSPENVRELLQNTPKFHDAVRSKLIKFGGPGYVMPDSGSFPTVEEAISMIRGMDALPMIAWLDGTNSGEADIHAFLSLLESKGVVAMNIIPERNWNLRDPEEKRIKLSKLYEAIRAANEFEFPISIGTEMNRAGLPFVDNFKAPELAPVVPDFLRGARMLYGHTLLARHADFGYWSSGAREAFGEDRAAKNRFYERVGAFMPSEDIRRQLGRVKGDPGGIFRLLGGQGRLRDDNRSRNI